MNARRLLAVGLMMEGGYLLFYILRDPLSDIVLFVALQALFSLALFLLVRSPLTHAGAERSSPEVRLGTALVIGFALLFRFTLMLHQPVASDDIYRYVWDGHVAHAGINPYQYAPADSVLAPLRLEGISPMINFPEMRTIYPPLAQGVFQVSEMLFGSSVGGMKLLFVLADLTTILLLARFLRGFMGHGDGRFLPALTLYAWSPVPVLYFALDGHVDAIGLPFLMLFLLAAGSSSRVRAALALGCATLAKLYPLFLAPFLVRAKREVWILVIPVLLLVVGYAWYYEPTGGIYESFLVYNARFEFNGAVYSLLRLTGLEVLTARILCALIFVTWVGILVYARRPLAESALLAFLGFLLCSPTAHPWYFSWLALLVAVRWSPSVFVLVSLTALANIVVYDYRLSGVWTDQPLLLMFEYLPFLVLFLREVMERQILRGKVEAA